MALTVYLLGKDFNGGNVASHVEHFGTAITAEQVSTIDADGTPILVGVVLLLTGSGRCS